ncbi:NAD(P)/FAD-dependent oxidoreductase [Marinobacterium sp. xm-d-530]|uniref:NAD(P)/FAD-dependent oxidoreductase n=1 Tax=Marinobacterium sp. xm-d-530 TaxID=2497747 RepID=UPI0015698776|nr:NAD(P)/FAD-dependent oxidoreductase [Marinobacterium sp. xm-d-530]NRQ01193.1 L-2-hydroxyglutarate oxidase LhgO [Marinobacterium sp. xm-d-530]
MLKTDVIVIGAGVVGLAVARKFALEGRETIVLEAESSFGQGVSSRNSEVIHAGLYYPPGSLKARVCRLGRDLLYDYCQSRDIAHKKIGKWLVANGETQEAKLEHIRQTAIANGCLDLSWIDAAEVAEREPELRATRVLNSPSTGIVDSHGLMLALLADLENAGGTVVYASPVLKGELSGGKLVLGVGGVSDCKISAPTIVNAAGLESTALATLLGSGKVPDIPKKGFAKGNYFSLSGKSPFARLIYPVPEPGGLGVHLTLDLQGRARFGPDVQWVDKPSYEVDESRKEQFARAIREYWPNCDAKRLSPDYAGIRPKIGRADEPDFCVQDAREHGLPGLVNLFGIESPGLTSSLALAEHIFLKN